MCGLRGPHTAWYANESSEARRAHFNGLSADSAALADRLLTPESKLSREKRERKNAILARRDKWRAGLACI